MRNCYKLIDYGNPKLSLYGCIVIVARNKSEIVEALEFDNLNDFYIVGKPPGTATVSHNILCGDTKILLKRSRMSNETFSFKS